jgi:hypothetical protein
VAFQVWSNPTYCAFVIFKLRGIFIRDNLTSRPRSFLPLKTWKCLYAKDQSIAAFCNPTPDFPICSTSRCCLLCCDCMTLHFLSTTERGSFNYCALSFNMFTHYTWFYNTCGWGSIKLVIRKPLHKNFLNGFLFSVWGLNSLHNDHSIHTSRYK